MLRALQTPSAVENACRGEPPVTTLASGVGIEATVITTTQTTLDVHVTVGVPSCFAVLAQNDVQVWPRPMLDEITCASVANRCLRHSRDHRRAQRDFAQGRVGAARSRGGPSSQL